MSSELSIHIREVKEITKGHRWRVSLDLTRSSAPIIFEIENPATSEVAEEVSWFLEKYAITDPFNASRARHARQLLWNVGKELYESVFTRNHVDIPEVKKLLVFVVCSEASQFQKLHWELLEGHCRYIALFK